MAQVLLDSMAVTTDAFAGMSSTEVSFTYAKLSWTNPSSSAADFRVVHEDGTATSTDTTQVSDGQLGEITVFPLLPGTEYKFYLERYEIDTWIRQTSSSSSLDYVMVTTPTTTVSVTSGSTSARATFQAPVSEADVWVAYREVDDTSGTYTTPTVAVSRYMGEALITGLSEGITYDVAVRVNFPQHILDEFSPSQTYATLHETTFTTSANAEMVITGPFASYMGIDWAASVDGQGSQYRIVNRVDDSQDDVLAESSTQTSATIQDLQPGSEYRIVLQRLEIDDSWSDQNEVVANTLSSSMSVTSSASKTLELSWTSLYTGAVFEVMYSTSGTTVANGQTQELSTILRNLDAGTTYEVDLVVHELGQAVGLARLGMTTNEGSFLQKKGKLIAGVVALVVLLLAIMMKRG